MSNKYIVVFKDDVTPQQIEEYVAKIDAEGGKVTNNYDKDILNGFAATIPDSFLKSLQADDIISYIEPDGIVTTQ